MATKQKHTENYMVKKSRPRGEPLQAVCDLPPEAEAVSHYAELEQRDEALETLSLESATL